MNTPPVIVVTGASRGIGLGIVRFSEAAGHRVAACARTRPEGAESTVTASVDVTDSAAVHSFARSVVERFGRIDCWINNAGLLGPVQFAHDMAFDDFQTVMSINMGGVFLGSQAMAQQVRRQTGGGVLINVSSGAARKGCAGWSAYCASKAAVDRFSESIALEEASHGLRVHSVAPGVVDTGMQAQIRSTDRADFPNLDRFLALKKDDAFNSAAWVGRQLLGIAFDTDLHIDEVLLRIPSE